MLALACFISSVLVTATHAASTASGLVCTSTQCLLGSTNSLLVASLSGSASTTTVLLLPDTYASTSPSLPSALLAVLQSPLTKISLSSPTFLNSTSDSSGSLSLPLTLAQSSPLLTFPTANFSGPGGSYSFPSANDTFSPQTISLNSLMLSSGTWAAFSTNSSASHLIVWESVSDLAQISSNAQFSTSSAVNLISLQSSSCPTPCSSAGTCTPAGTCSCPSNYSGSSCEACAPGFFGPSCKACASDCAKCDDGSTGTGACLSGIATNAPSTCNCLNGVCASSGGACTCNSGWATDLSSNSTQCSVCAAGFFDSGNGECQACALGCSACSNGSGTCTACASGLTQDSSSPNECTVPASTTTCADGTFNNAGTCTACSSLCKTCKGPLSTDCIICGAGRSSLNGQCVSVDSNGVCQESSSNTSMVVNNAKNECDTCPGTCTVCEIPGFSVASTIGQAECTKCLPGLVLSGGRCVDECPAGSFIDPKGDGFTCQACDASCSTCAGGSTFCLTCSQSGFSASNGTCVSTCPSSTFSSSGACLPCHADCASCSGAGFDQCSSCSSSRPVLSSSSGSSGGRCLLTCGKSQFYDSTAGGTGACTNCDSSCSTCTGAGSASCLTCPSGKILQGGTCVDARCSGGDDVGIISAMGGICLSSFIVPNPQASSVTITGPTSTVTVVSSASAAPSSSSKSGLTTWEIALMAGGIVALLILGLMLWRRQARIARAHETQAFKESKLEKSHGLLSWFGFGGSSSKRDRKRRNGRGARGSLSTFRSGPGVEGWRYEMESVEQGMARRRSSVLHSPISDRFAAAISPTDVRSRRQQNRSASVYSHATSASSFTSPYSPRERDEFGNPIGLPPRDDRRDSRAGTTWTAPTVWSQPSDAAGDGNRYKRSSPPPMPEYNPNSFDAAPSSNHGYLSVPQPRQPIKDTSTARFGNGGGEIGPDLLSSGLFATPTGSSGHSAGLNPAIGQQRTGTMPQMQPLVDVPLMSSDDLSRPSANHWMQAMDHMPSNSPQRGANTNPFRM